MAWAKNGGWRFDFFFVVAIVGQLGCASKLLDDQGLKEIKKNEEFENLIQVQELQKVEPLVEAPPLPTTVQVAPKERPGPQVKALEPKKKAIARPKEPTVVARPVPTTVVRRKEPVLEDDEGFVGRRPVVDPFVVGEKVTLALKYFNVEAGTMTLEVRPLVRINGNPSYHFGVRLRSNKVFSLFYSVDDYAETFVDYQLLVPRSMSIHVNESKQVREIRSFFNLEKRQASFWEKKITRDKGEENRRLDWEIDAYAQNVVSAAFYLRTFTYRPGKKISFAVADDGKNLVFSGDVLRREVLKTKIGDFPTFVIKPQVTIDGVFKPMGDVFIWITDDPYKSLIRLESKIKIGTIIGSLVSLTRENEPTATGSK